MGTPTSSNNALSNWDRQTSATKGHTGLDPLDLVIKLRSLDSDKWLAGLRRHLINTNQRHWTHELVEALFELMKHIRIYRAMFDCLEHAIQLHGRSGRNWISKLRPVDIEKAIRRFNIEMRYKSTGDGDFVVTGLEGEAAGTSQVLTPPPTHPDANDATGEGAVPASVAGTQRKQDNENTHGDSASPATRKRIYKRSRTRAMKMG